LPLVLSTSDFLWFVDQALEEMIAILRLLGDDFANRKPALDGANSPYAIVSHCLGVMVHWGGRMVAGRQVERDREAELRAQGDVEDLVSRTRAARLQLERDISLADCSASPRGVSDPEDLDLPFGRSQGGVLMHIYEELAQHLGQMELTRDILLADS